jgi:hypothetical protein
VDLQDFDLTMIERYDFPPCNLCERIFKSIRANYDDLPPDEARIKTLNEFYKMREEADCQDFYTCMPLARHGYQDIHS